MSAISPSKSPTKKTVTFSDTKEPQSKQQSTSSKPEAISKDLFFEPILGVDQHKFKLYESYSRSKVSIKDNEKFDSSYPEHKILKIPIKHIADSEDQKSGINRARDISLKQCMDGIDSQPMDHPSKDKEEDKKFEESLIAAIDKMIAKLMAKDVHQYVVLCDIFAAIKNLSMMVSTADESIKHGIKRNVVELYTKVALFGKEFHSLAQDYRELDNRMKEIGNLKKDDYHRTIEKASLCSADSLSSSQSTDAPECSQSSDDIKELVIDEGVDEERPSEIEEECNYEQQPCKRPVKRKRIDEKIKIRVCRIEGCSYFQKFTSGDNFKSHFAVYHSKKEDALALVVGRHQIRCIDEEELSIYKDKWDDQKKQHRRKSAFPIRANKANISVSTLSRADIEFGQEE